MSEYFIYANSFAAPFCSDDSTHFVEAETADAALEKFASEYRHPAGLYAAICYASADAYHKKAAPLAKWLCNHEAEKMRLTEGLGAYSYFGAGPGQFEIDGVRHTVDDPKGGRIYPTTSAHQPKGE